MTCVISFKVHAKLRRDFTITSLCKNKHGVTVGDEKGVLDILAGYFK
jgi:hypothetical protein